MPETDLDRAFETCRKINAHHGKTYYFSTLFFPPPVRRSVHALYGFVRYPDEIVDNPPDGSNPGKELAEYRYQTVQALKHGDSDIPVLKAFSHVAREYEIPADYPLAFLDAMAMDLSRCSYDTFEDLQEYTYGSASAVGLMMCHIMGLSDWSSLDQARELGLAMQLTNFLRDIGEDWHDRRRIYIPQEDMAKFGYTEQMLCNGIINDAFCALMKFEIERARKIYVSADTGIASITPNCQFPVRLARTLYARILDKIEDNQYDVFGQRARTSALEKAATVVRLRLQSA